MNRLLRLAFVVFLICFTGTAFAQGSGIKGVLKDEKGNPVVNANVEVISGGIVNGRDLTDFDGNYTVKPLNGGRYSVRFSYLGKDLTITDISLAGDQTRTVNGTLNTTNEVTDKSGKKVDATVHATRIFQAPLIDPENPGGKNVKGSGDLEKGNLRSAAEAAQLSTQVVTSGGGLSIGGGRNTGTKYIIDGVQQNPGAANFTNLPPGSVEAVSTFSSGVPARYGDASGGIISITTKGSTSRTQGNIQYEHSLEGFNQNQLTINLSGPLYSKRDSNGGKRPVVGYTLNADGVYASDNSPVYYKTYYVNDAKLAELEAHPLQIVQTNGVARPEYATQFVHLSDLEERRRQPNAQYYRGKLQGKLDFNLTSNVSVRVGAEYNNENRPSYDRQYSLFSADNFSRVYSQRGVGYLRFTQKFGSKTDTKELKDNQITNAFYTVQADYSKDFNTTQDPDKKHNTFDYGYVGKFEELYRPNFTDQEGNVNGLDPLTQKTGILLRGYTPAGVIFTPGTQNPILTNYTKDAYAFNPNPVDQTAIQAARGLRNGDSPPLAYSLFRNVGAEQTGWNQNNTDQVSLGVDASFDIKHKKTTHSVEFGLYYQQRNSKRYSINGAYLWTLMRQATNRVVNQEVDPRFATFIVNGDTVSYQDVLAGRVNPGLNDTILYRRKFDTTAQGAFDRHLREKLGLNRYSDAYINTDKYDPSFYSLGMFSADDLLNGGSSAVGYYGYDYTGQPVNGTVNFNDFWTKKDGEGYYTRPIGAYRPNYIAGYISDYVQYKDFRITLGVRVERFDNNTKVLKDPYSLYAVKTVGDAGVKAPSNIGSDYVVYVGNNATPNAAVIGYRNGDSWYDAAGREVEDPQVLKTGTNSDNLQPLLQKTNTNIKDSTFDPNASFTDYKPQVNVMPRINFSFPLNDNALFYAHYDIMYQRPNTGAFAVQTDYLFLDQNPGQVYGNSNLKPERAIDYEVGFQQKLTDNSGVTISGFYKERKDQIQVRPYLYAYPITYYTYGNRDYSNYKGLSINYDLRRIGNLSMNVNYTLSFTEGTGSSASSANGGSGNNVSSSSLLQQLIAAGLPNLRTQFPLDYDSRHNINAQVDYRFRDGGGPVIGNKHIFENAGINLVFRARSGEPYTKYQSAQNITGQGNSSVIAGAVNGSRLQGHYAFDLNLDKTVSLGFLHKAKEGEVARPSRLGLNIYAYAKNVFNIRDIVSVYGYTGRADDDGFLTSPQGLTTIPAQADPQSYIDLYTVYSHSPYQVGAPRSIIIGLRLNF